MLISSEDDVDGVAVVGAVVAVDSSLILEPTPNLRLLLKDLASAPKFMLGAVRCRVDCRVWAKFLSLCLFPLLVPFF